MRASVASAVASGFGARCGRLASFITRGHVDIIIYAKV